MKRCDSVEHMFKRIFLTLSLCTAAAYAADTPPSDASVKQLLEAAQARKMADSVVTHMDGLLKQAVEQATAGRQLPANVRSDIDKKQAEMMAEFKQVLDWKKLEPVYLRVYQKSFTQEEVNGMIAFYKTPAGQAVVNKMPVVMQNTMHEMQEMVGPMMERVRRMQQEIAAEIKAESGKKGG